MRAGYLQGVGKGDPCGQTRTLATMLHEQVKVVTPSMSLAIQAAPLGISLGISAALVVSAYEQLLRAIEQRQY